MTEIDLTEPPEDQALLNELGEALRACDPVPDQWRFAALGSFSWRSLEADLAELTFDSMAGTAGAALVRGPATRERIVVFEAPGLRVEIELAPGPGATGTYRVTGQLIPEVAGTVELRQATGSMTVTTDANGCFQADGVAAGPLSLRCSVPGGAAPVDTAWLIV